MCLFLLIYYFALDTTSDPNPFNESTQSSKIIIAAACLVGTNLLFFVALITLFAIANLTV